ncbi:MAG: class I SAM-dependent methyltransferase [Sulfuricella sp.]|nr:class I SAM-dependent methyltransferase [Sulfuricella sp.]
MSDLSHTFGYQDVDQDERRRRIRRVFAGVARRYDLMNDAMSFGIHRLWKRTLARAADPLPGQVIVDLAGGTGDVARLLADADRRVLVCDPSLAMMGVGRERGMRHVSWLAGSGEGIPLASASVDTVTIAFGIRNVTRLDDALREVLRVLKPGGRFFCLEFSRPWRPIRPFYDLFSFAVIPRLGAWIAREPEAYAYLVESIRRFPNQEAFKQALEQAGFADVRYRNLTFGIACLHSATKLS